MPTNTRASKSRDQEQPTSDHEDESSGTIVQNEDSSTPLPKPKKKPNNQFRNVSDASEDTIEPSQHEISLGSADSTLKVSTAPTSFKDALKQGQKAKGELFRSFKCLSVGDNCILPEFGRLMFSFAGVVSDILEKGGREMEVFNEKLRNVSYKLHALKVGIQAKGDHYDAEDVLQVVETSIDFIQNWLEKDVNSLQRQPGCLSLIVLMFENHINRFLFGPEESAKLVVKLKALMRTKSHFAYNSAAQIFRWSSTRPNNNKRKNGDGDRKNKEEDGQKGNKHKRRY